MSIPTDHPYDFDPTHGLGLDDLLALRPPEAPQGFDAFWRARLVRAMGVDPRPQISHSAARHGPWLVHDMTYTSTDGFRIGGWLLRPGEGPIRRGLVVGHGYGGRDQPDFDIPVTETAVLFPCFRGLSRSRHPPISSDPAWHVLHEIDNPERYILGGCVEDLWTAVSVLTGLYPALEGQIGYSGISFGGGIGALAIPFDRRIDRGPPRRADLREHAALAEAAHHRQRQRGPDLSPDASGGGRDPAPVRCGNGCDANRGPHADRGRPLRPGGGAALPVFRRQCAANRRQS